MLKDLFNYRDHINNEFKGILPYSKKDYSGFINLSSNELRNDEYDNFFRSFLQQVSINKAFSYPFPQATEKFIARELNINPENLLFTAGSDSAIQVVIQALTSRNKTISIQVPNYENYSVYSNLSGLSMHTIDWYFDDTSFVEKSVKHLSETLPSMFVLTSPNGWTGRSLPYDSVKFLAEEAQRNNHILCIDEAYKSFHTVNYDSLALQFNNVILIRSFSKSFGMAGLRCGVIIGDPELLHYVKKWRPTNSISWLTFEFLKYCFMKIKYIEGFQHQMVKTRENLRKELADLFSNWEVHPTNTNFMLVDLKDVKQQAELVSYLASKKIVVKKFENNESLKTFIRITVPSSNEYVTLLNELKEYKTKQGC